MPLYPNEKLLWDPHQVPTQKMTSDTVLALPKLNLQFLTFHDYLLRSFKLYRLESAYEVRCAALTVLAWSRATEPTGLVLMCDCAVSVRRSARTLSMR